MCNSKKVNNGVDEMFWAILKTSIRSARFLRSSRVASMLILYQILSLMSILLTNLKRVVSDKDGNFDRSL